MNVPSTFELSVPCAGAVTMIAESASCSAAVSLASTFSTVGVSSASVKASSLALGAVFCAPVRKRTLSMVTRLPVAPKPSRSK